MTEGLARAGFDIDLRDGRAAEDALVHVFLQCKVEVKRDERAATSGNLFVEYRQKGRRSGIATTTADWWAFVVEGRWHLVPTWQLIRLCRRAYKDGRHTKGGDYNLYEGVLLPIIWLTDPPVGVFDG